MNRLADFSNELIFEMSKITRAVNNLIEARKYNELAKLFIELCTEIHIQRTEFKAKEINPFNSSFSFNEYPRVSALLLDRAFKVSDTKEFVSNFNERNFILENTVMNLVKEEKFGLVCWMLSALAMEIISNRDEYKLEDLSLPQYLVPESYKAEILDDLVEKFQTALDQPPIDPDDIPF